MAATLVDWSRGFETGLDWQDAQHRELFDRLVALDKAIEQRQSREVVSRTLTFLDDYVETHFGQEEEWMQKTAYQEAAQHRAEHEDFRLMLATFHQFVTRTRKLVLATKIRAELNQWFLQHIQTTDKRLGGFLKKKGAGA
ncbi:MAG: bacteriohemerythrin [Desulfobulbaceae bacterium]|nr:bacteriohemerythrin [Desulfobulbaceae bacterium]